MLVDGTSLCDNNKNNSLTMTTTTTTNMREWKNEINTKVYIRDERFAWLPGRILRIDGPDHVTVRVELPLDWEETTLGGNTSYDLDGKLIRVSVYDYPNGLLPRRNNQLCRDMSELPFLHEASILYQIKDRHARQKPYTRVAEIIVAVNPCHFVPNMYSEDEQKQYAMRLVYNNNNNDNPKPGMCRSNEYSNCFVCGTPTNLIYLSHWLVQTH
jgi:hypothetical protein